MSVITVREEQRKALSDIEAKVGDETLMVWIIDGCAEYKEAPLMRRALGFSDFIVKYVTERYEGSKGTVNLH